MWRWIITFAIFICALSHVQAEGNVDCGELNSTACQQLVADELSIMCFDCNTTSANFRHCHRSECAIGEVCMTKSLQSMVDGHRAYQLSCETKQHCDGNALSLTFGVGRRDLQSRDIYISCCKTNLCNRPPGVVTETLPPGEKTTHTPIGTHHHGCRRDITVVVDDARRSNVNATDVRHFLRSVVHGLHIGQNGSLMSLITYTHNNVSRHWHLQTYLHSKPLLHAISNTTFFHSNINTDLNTAINYLIKHNATTVHHHDDRPRPPNVLIFLTSHDANNVLHLRNAAKKLHAMNKDVIAIGLSGHVANADLRPVATDAGHEFIIGNSKNLQHIVPNVLQLICG